MEKGYFRCRFDRVRALGLAIIFNKYLRVSRHVTPSAMFGDIIESLTAYQCNQSLSVMKSSPVLCTAFATPSHLTTRTWRSRPILAMRSPSGASSSMGEN